MRFKWWIGKNPYNKKHSWAASKVYYYRDAISPEQPLCAYTIPFDTSEEAWRFVLEQLKPRIKDEHRPG